MANALVELLKREQVKLARNTYELAGYYCPMGRIPDVIDFAMMQKRVELLAHGKTQVKELWPNASDSFAAKLASRVEYTRQQLESVEALQKTCKADDGLTTEEMYESGFKNSRLYQAQVADTNSAA